VSDFHDTMPHKLLDPMNMRPNKSALYYEKRPRGSQVLWEGPGWYTISAKKTLLTRVG
jgi:hypothetical protein